MIDLHTHVLPGIDDGAEDAAEALAILRAAALAGTTTLVATPHVLNRLDAQRNGYILEAFESVKQALQSNGAGLNLIVGSEIYFQPKMLEFLEFPTATINSTGKYMLIEFPMGDVPGVFETELRKLVWGGVNPIVAHPERNAKVIAHPELVERMVEAGALIQLNAGSLTGDFGRSIRKLAQYLLKIGLVHFIASDAHSVRSRGPDLSAALVAASEIVGVAAASRFVNENPQIVLSGQIWQR